MNQTSRQPEPDFTELSLRVYRLCLALLRNETDARDAAQESLMRAWAGVDRKKDDTAWWTWVGGFAVRVCREVQRRRGRSEMELPDDLGAPGDGKLAGAQLTEFAQRLHEQVMHLPQRQREVVTLRWIVGYSTTQASEVLDCPEGTVKSNLHKAVAQLRRSLGSIEVGLMRESDCDA